jgi:Holliday junction resolvase RusA-like endonuclease
VPKSYAKAKTAACLAGQVHPTGRPDADNVLKLVTDAMIGVFFLDDAQLVRMAVSKHYDTRPHVRVTLEDMQAAPVVVSGGLFDE